MVNNQVKDLAEGATAVPCLLPVRSRCAGLALVWLAVLSIVVSGVLGRQPTTLCFANDGHLEVRIAGTACEGCPVSACKGERTEGHQGAPTVVPSKRCCYDMPMAVYPVMGSLPKPLEVQDSHAIAQPAWAAKWAALDSLLAQKGHRLCGEPSPPPIRQTMACLRSVQLLV